MMVRQIDHEDAKRFLQIPEVWDLSSGGMPVRDFNMPAAALSIGGELDGELIGLAMLTRFRDGCKFHFHCLREYRRRYARPLVAQILDFVRDRAPLYAVIPCTRRVVINFARKSGFTPLECHRGREILKWGS